MDLTPYRNEAHEWIAHARERNASHEHPESLKLAAAGAKILALCDEIDRLSIHAPLSEDAMPQTPTSDVAEPKTRRSKK